MVDTTPERVMKQSVTDSIGTHEAGEQIGAMLGDNYTTDESEIEEEPEAGAEPEPEIEEEEGEEPESEPEAEDEEAPEEEPEEEPGEEPVYTVKIDGKVSQVTLEELRNGYQRGADYARKTSTLAEQRREVESLQQQVERERQQYAQGIQMLQGQITNEYQALKMELDSMDREDDPLGYMAKRDKLKDVEERFRAAQQEQLRVKQLSEMQQTVQMKRHLEHEMELLYSALPEMKKEQTRRELQRKVRDYAVSTGYSPEEIDSLSDHRAVIVLDKARRWDELQKKDLKTKKVKKAPKMMKSGSKPQGGNAKSKNIRHKMDRLRKEHSVDAAADIFQDMFG